MTRTLLWKKIFGSPMRNRFALFFFALALGPALTLGAIAIYFINLSHPLDVAALESQLVDQKIAEIQSFFADAEGAIDLQVGFEQKSEIERSQQAFLLDGLLKEHGAFKEVHFENLAGIVTAKRTHAGGSASSTAIDLPEQSTGGLEDVSKLQEFIVPKSGRPYIGPVHETLGGPVITIAAPVHNKNGDIIQVLSADVSLATLISSIDKVRLGSTGYVLIFDKNGALVSRPFSRLVPGTDFSHTERVSRVLSGAALSGLDATDRYESYVNGAPVAGMGKRVPVLGWAILAEWPVADADSVINDLRFEVLGLT